MIRKLIADDYARIYLDRKHGWPWPRIAVKYNVPTDYVRTIVNIFEMAKKNDYNGLYLDTHKHIVKAAIEYFDTYHNRNNNSVKTKYTLDQIGDMLVEVKALLVASLRENIIK